jgi:hypothetical protein
LYIDCQIAPSQNPQQYQHSWLCNNGSLTFPLLGSCCRTARLITNGVHISYNLFVVRSLQHTSRYNGSFIWYTTMLPGQSLRHKKPRYNFSLNSQQQCLLAGHYVVSNA